MFEPDFSSARLDDGTRVTFTQAEAQLLRHLAKHPGQTLSRDQILDAMTQAGSDKSDRTVDFLINRVRRKLNDTPKEPRFIATRYGGGYVWVGPRNDGKSAPDPTTDIVVGPLRGLQAAGIAIDVAADFAQRLADAFNAVLGPEKSTAVALNMDQPTDPARHVMMQVEMTFFRDQGGLECIVTCRSGPERRVVFAERIRARTADSSDLVPEGGIQNLAARMLNERWRADVDHHTHDSPLPVAMQNASVEQFDSRKTLQEIGPRLRTIRAAHPDDPHVKLTFATYLHSEYVIRGYDPAFCEPERRQGDLAQIEALVLDALDYAQSRPHLAVMAAKLLYFVDRGYKALALELAHDAHRSNTAIAPSLAIVGQLHAFLGDTETAIDYLKQADALADRNSTFDRYVLVLICQALIAGGRRDELEPFRTRIYGQHPLLRVFLEPIFTDPDQPSMRAKGAMLVMSKSRTHAFLSNSHFIWTRLCEDPAHRVNALRAPISLAVRRHGRGVVPEEIQSDIPGLFI